MNQDLATIKLTFIILIIIHQYAATANASEGSLHNKETRGRGTSSELIRFLCRQGSNSIQQSDWKSICKDHLATRGGKQHVREQRQPRSSYNDEDTPTFDSPSYQPKRYARIHSRYMSSQDPQADRYSLLRRIANSLRQKYVSLSDDDSDYDRKIEVSQGTDERGYYTTASNDSPLYLIKKWSSQFLGDN